jgi:hypothetical protein
MMRMSYSTESILIVTVRQEISILGLFSGGGFLERAMGIGLHPKFLSLTETRCYQPLGESIVAMLPTKPSSTMKCD